MLHFASCLDGFARQVLVISRRDGEKSQTGVGSGLFRSLKAAVCVCVHVYVHMLEHVCSCVFTCVCEHARACAGRTG